MRLRAVGVLGRGQRVLPQRATLDRADEHLLAGRDPGPPTDPRVLAEPASSRGPRRAYGRGH
jgi:hypothetical protein